MANIQGTGETRLSARYAAALYALADERGILAETTRQMAALGDLIAGSADLQRLISNPFTDLTQAQKALDAAMTAGGFLPELRHFVGVAVTNRRLADLPALIKGFAAYESQKRGEITAEVTSAQALSDLQRTQLSARLTEAGYSNVKLIEHLDPALLGGLVLKIGAKIYDTSLKSRLSRLTYSLKGAA